MPEVFAHTGYWVALFNPNDQLHQKAREVTRELGDCRKVTTEMVLVEFLNFVSGEEQYLRRLAGEKVKELSANPDVEVVAQTSGQFQAAVDRYLAEPNLTGGMTLSLRGGAHLACRDRIEPRTFRLLIKEV